MTKPQFISVKQASFYVSVQSVLWRGQSDVSVSS